MFNSETVYSCQDGQKKTSWILTFCVLKSKSDKNGGGASTQTLGSEWHQMDNRCWENHCLATKVWVASEITERGRKQQ